MQKNENLSFCPGQQRKSGLANRDGGRPFVIVPGLVMLRGTIGQPGYLYLHRKIRIVYQFPTVRMVVS